MLLNEVKLYIDCNFKNNYSVNSESSDELKATLLRKKEELIKKLTNIDDTVKSYKQSLYKLLKDEISTSFNSIYLTLRPPPELKLYHEHLKKYSDYIYRVEEFGKLDEYKKESMRLLNIYYYNKMTQYNIQKHTLETKLDNITAFYNLHVGFKENPTSIEAKENDETRMYTLSQKKIKLEEKKSKLEEKIIKLEGKKIKLEGKFDDFLEHIRIFFNTYYLKDKNLTHANITEFKTKFENHREILISLVEQSFSRCTSVKVR